MCKSIVCGGVVTCNKSGCDWLYEGLCPERTYWVRECRDDSDVKFPRWEALEDSDEKYTTLMHWLYNYKVYFQDGMTVQHQEHAIYFVKCVEQILDTPWMVCVHVFDVCEQEGRKIFFKVDESLPTPVQPST